MCARRRSNFLSRRRKKVTKERATLHAASLRFAAGNLRCSCVGRAAELATRCALRSNNRSESVHEARALRRPRRPTPCAPRRIVKGTRESDIRTGHRCARPRLRSARRLRPREGAERSKGPRGCSAVGCSAVHPPAGCACGGAVAGWHARRSARASCSGSPWLSERRAQRKASSTAHPAIAPTQVCPEAQRRGRRLGVAFSLVTFFWRSKRKLLARRATPGLRSQPRHTAKSASKPRLRQAQPERFGSTKTIAFSAYQ